ncbi:uncharacterized protein LOC127565643 isoform X1 [Drosophila albomicans]|uniref:Uncharacterized protein LOC127565643 isoform X1 n=1 Tax=Drosophila albomicans TaxID=7291 RepID=A0A9C6T446_DROAB|nr:uncharacterized protein LOC127565643 isoform X1 [Drosophila albomicans]
MDSDTNECLTPKNNILAIGDQFPRNPHKKRDRAKRDFNAEFTKRLSQLVMGDPNVIAEDKFVMDEIYLNIVKVDDLTQHYVFSINKNTTDKWMSHVQLIDVKYVFRAIKKKLSNEKWISEYVMEKTFDNKDTKRFKVDDMVYQAKSDSIKEQRRQIFNYVCFLQQEFRKQRKLLPATQLIKMVLMTNFVIGQAYILPIAKYEYVNFINQKLKSFVFAYKFVSSSLGLAL